MIDRNGVRLALAGLLLAASGWLQAASGGGLLQAGNDLGDRASLQRGAQLYVNYCGGCHSLKYLRYSRLAEDLGLDEQQVQANLNFTGAAFGEQINAVMPAEAGKWFGKAPPDLSLVARVRGEDWIYTYLHAFYQDEQALLGWNNTLFPDVAMPNPLWELQGVQRLRGERESLPETLDTSHLERVADGVLAPAQFDQTVRDITNFLAYAAEPAALKRQRMGIWVIGFLAVFTLLAWLLKREYWKDVH